MFLPAAEALAALCLAAGLTAFVMLRWSLRKLHDSCASKKADRLAVNAAACFAWPALVWALLQCSARASGTGAGGAPTLGLVGQVTCIVVLAYLCQEVRAVVPYIGPLEDYQGGDTLFERATQISTAAFATGTILLSTAKELTARVAPFVFLALLLCVVSAVPGTSAQKRRSKHLTWESIQKSSMSMAAGLLALAIAICVDANLRQKCG